MRTPPACDHVVSAESKREALGPDIGKPIASGDCVPFRPVMVIDDALSR